MNQYKTKTLLALLLAAALLVPRQSEAQLPLYVDELDIELDELFVQVQCDNDAVDIINGNPEPRIWVQAGHSGGNLGPNVYNNLGDEVQCGWTNTVANTNLSNFLDLCGVTSFDLRIEGWENDCGNDNVYEDPCGILNTLEDDEYVNYTQTLDFINTVPEGVSTAVEASVPGNFYGARVNVFWTSSTSTTISGPNEVCSGSSITLTALHNGTEHPTSVFNWYSTPDRNPANLLFTGDAFSVSPGAATTYYVAEEFNNSCESKVVSHSVTVLPGILAPTVTSPVDICEGDEGTFEAAGAGTINWYSDAGLTTSIGMGSPFQYGDMLAPGTTTVYATVFDGTCESPATPVTVNVTAAPPAPIVADEQTCPGGTATLTATSGGINGNFTWYLDAAGDIPIGTGNPFVTPSINVASQTYYLGESDPGTGCTSPLVPVTITTDLVINSPITSDQNICAGSSASLFAITTSGLNGTMTWYNDVTTNNAAYIGNPFVTPALFTPGVFSYWVVEEVDGCESAPVEVVVTVNPKPVPPTTTGATICFGETAMLSAMGGGGTLNWYGDASGNSLLATGDNFTTPVLTASTTYYVGETDANGCDSDLEPVTATVLPEPNAPVASNVTVCEGEDVILSATTTSATGDLIFYDNTNTQVSMSAVPPSVATFNAGALAPGTYTYFAAYNDGSCESELVPITVNVNALPAAPNVADVFTCEGGIVNISAGVGTFNWYDDPTAGNLIYSGQTYTTPPLFTATSYYVSQVVNGCEGSRDEVVANVFPTLLTPNVSYNGPLCEGSTLQLSTDFNADYTYSWTGPNGFTSSDQNPQILNASPIFNSGTYSLVVTDGNGCSASNSLLVEVIPAPQSVPLFTNSPVCEGGNIQLTTSNVPGATYTWFDVNGQLGTTATPQFTVSGATAADAGTYSVSVEVNGCTSAAASAQVVVSPLPATPAVSNNGPVCAGESVVVSGPVVPNANYTWNGPNGFLSTQPSFTIDNASAADAGAYTLVVSVDGCVSMPSITNVVILASPVIPSAPTNNSPLCEGETLNLGAPAITGVDYMWTGPGNFSSTEQNPSVTNVNDGDHQGVYTLVVTDQATGCESMPMSTYVQIDHTPSGISASNSGATCEGGSIQLFATNILDATYDWTGPNGFTSTEQNPVLDNISVADEGLYMVEITVGNCTGEAAQTFVDVNSGPTINAGADVVIIQGGTANLSASGGLSYQWSPADNLSNANVPNPVFDGPVGVYTYTVTGYDSNGCSNTDEVQVTVVPNEDLEFIDLITPNNDGVNDTWKITYLENIKDGYTLSLYARGGVQIFTTQAYNNDWDGTYEGSDLPDGTYWYVLRANDGRIFKGAVTIKR